MEKYNQTHKIEQNFKTVGSVKRESICPFFSLVFCSRSRAQRDRAVQDKFLQHASIGMEEGMK